MTTDAVALPAAQRTLPGLLRHAAGFGDSALLSIGDARWTHADAAGHAARRAALLQAAGIGAGDRVALMCSNRVEFIETFLACGWLGAVVVPINTAAMGPQIAYILANSGARLLVIETSLMDHLAQADLQQAPWPALWWLGEGGDEAPLPAHVNGGSQPFPAAGEVALEAAAVGPGDPLAILYTSGTTGPPKGVICPHAQLHWWGLNSAQVLGVRRDDVLCTTLPLFHINALNTFVQALLAGCQVVYPPRFSASRFWPLMKAADASVVYLLGAMVPMLLAQPPHADERGHRVRIGLGPGVPAAAAETFRQRCGVALVDGFGSTESNFVIASNAGPAGVPAAPGTMGWLRAGFDARVADDDDNPLPDGEAGELLLRADAPFAFASGYFGMPEATLRAWRNLWFHTGDRVVRDADGNFRFVDRLKDMIRRRGENISSYEVEQVLLSHPAVAAAAVFPVRSDLAEDEVMATLVLHDGAVFDATALIGHCQPRLPRFALPRYIDISTDLPRTENGKVQKFKLRERGVTADTWQRPDG